MVSRYEKKFGIIDVPEDSIYLYKNGFGKVSVLSSGKHLVAGEIAKYNMESNIYHYNDIIVKNSNNQNLLFDVTVKDKIAGGKKHFDYDGVLYRKAKLKGQELTNAEASDWWDENHPVKKYAENEEQFAEDMQNEADKKYTKDGLTRSIVKEGLQSFEDTSFKDFQDDKYDNDVVEEVYSNIRKSLLKKGVQLEEFSIDKVKVYENQERHTKDLNISIDDKEYVEVIESKMPQASNIDFIKRGSNTIINVDKDNKGLEDFDDDSIDDFEVAYVPLDKEVVEEKKELENDSNERFVIEYAKELDVEDNKDSEAIIEENKKFFYEFTGLKPSQTVEENNGNDDYAEIDQEKVTSEEAINMNREYLEARINNLNTGNIDKAVEETTEEVIEEEETVTEEVMEEASVEETEKETLVIPEGIEEAPVEQPEEVTEEELGVLAIATNEKINSLEGEKKPKTSRKKGLSLIRDRFIKPRVREGINTSLLASSKLDDELSLTKESLAEKEAEVERLKALLAEASSHNAKLQSDVAEKQATIDKLNMDLDDKDREINRLELVKEKVAKSNQDLFDDNESLNSNVQFLNNELESLRNENKETEEKYEELEKKYNEKCVALAAVSNPDEELLAENKKLQDENESLKSENEQLTNDNNSLIETKDRLTSLNENLNNTNKKITEDNANLTQTKNDLIAEKEKLTQANRDLKKKNYELLTKESELSDENIDLKASNESLNGKVKTITEEKNELAKLNNALEEANKGLLDENDELKRISRINNLVISDVDIERIVLVKANGELRKYRINIKGRLNYNGKFTQDLIIDKMVYDEVKNKMDGSSINDFEIINYDCLCNKMSLSKGSNELVTGNKKTK